MNYRQAYIIIKLLAYSIQESVSTIGLVLAVLHVMNTLESLMFYKLENV